MIINNKILPLKNKYEIKNNKMVKINYLKVKLLILIKDRLNFSNMFNGITSLTQFYTSLKNETFNSPDYLREELEYSSNDDNKNTNIIHNDQDINNSKFSIQNNFYSLSDLKYKNTEIKKINLFDNLTKTYSLLKNNISQIISTSKNLDDIQNSSDENKIISMISSKFFNPSKKNSFSFINLHNLFKKCTSIEYISGISDWDIKNCFDISSMFSECSSLKNILDISQWKTDNITNMSSMFNGCSSLKSLPNISGWNTSRVINMNNIFKGCSLIDSLPDISEWNTRQVTDMNNIFNGCSSLKSLPEISKWNTSNLKNISHMFDKCSKLLKLPDISNWITDNINNINSLFNECSLLNSLPDISKWKINKVTDLSFIFAGNSSLISLPNISLWETNEVKNLSAMFYNCSSLISLPDLSKWNIDKVTDMKYMFCDCSSLVSLPDISKWNTDNVTDISYMFFHCTSLKYFPNISNWNTDKVKNFSKFFGCSSLISFPDLTKKNILNNEDKQKLCERKYEHPSSYISGGESRFIYLLCKECYRCPKVKINDDFSYNLTCFCQKVKKVNFKFFLDNFTNEKSNEKQDNNSKNLLEKQYHTICEYHQKKFYAYCLKCKLILCNECIKKFTYHQTHPYIYFDDSNIKEKLKKIIEFMEDKVIKNSILERNKYYFEEIKNSFFVIKLILLYFNQYPCYFSYRSIENVSIFLDKLRANNINNQIQFLEKVRKKVSLTKIKEDKIITIEINQSNFNDISILTNKTFNNLKRLSLSNNHIINIKPLATINAPLLTWIDLSINYINDESLNLIAKIIENFDKLDILNLNDNKFTNPDIFSFFDGKKNLTKFNIGKNIFEINQEKKNNIINNNKQKENEIIIDRNKKYKMHYIKEINLGNGAFDDITIEIVSSFVFSNLIIIELNGNGFHSLKFVENLECENLEQFLASENNIKDYKPLKKFNTLKMIDLNNNPIKNIDDLKEFVEFFPNLEKFYLEKTEIDTNNDEINKKIKRIREMYKNIEFFFH